MSDIPAFDDLPKTAEGVRSGWGIFGKDDNVGLINLLTPERIASAAQLVKRGALFSLNAPMDALQPPLAMRRGILRHTILHIEGTPAFDDVIDNFYPQVSSQWDSLAHVGAGVNVFYNGANESDIYAGRRNTIEHWAERGIAGRAVLFDMVRALASAGRAYDPGTSTPFDVEELEIARKHAGVELRTGDIVLVYTGVLEWYQAQPAAVRRELPPKLAVAGLAHTEELCRYLWDHHVAAIGTDTFGAEVWPPNRDEPYGFLHRILIGQFGMALGELWWLKDLAEDCANDGVYEAFLASSPINVPGGIGSPANAMAIK